MLRRFTFESDTETFSDIFNVKEAGFHVLNHGRVEGDRGPDIPRFFLEELITALTLLNDRPLVVTLANRGKSCGRDRARSNEATLGKRSSESGVDESGSHG